MSKLLNGIYYGENEGILGLARTGEGYEKAKREYQQFRDEFEELLLTSLKPQLDRCIFCASWRRWRWEKRRFVWECGSVWS